MGVLKAKVGDIFTSKQCGEFIVVEYINSANVVVKFIDTGYETITRHSQVLSGQVKDRSLPSVYGVGVIGDSYSCWDGKSLCKEYNLWHGILERCYSENSLKVRPTYKDCYVSENFKHYSYFYEWCHKQVGFGKDGFELDKDLLSARSKTYNEDVCVFLPKEINTAIIRQNVKRGKYLVGVTLHKNTNKFIAQLSANSGRVRIGQFDTELEAFSAYKYEKEKYLKELAEKWKGKIDDRAYEALINYEVDIDD